jgi:transcriptional regulator with XRE-family HTH domain
VQDTVQTIRQCNKMKAAKKKKLQEAGWVVGSASEFLELSEAEETIVAMKLALASKLKDLRREKHLTQQDVAKRIGSSQSRVAKMEIADKSVSMELFIRSLVSLGTPQVQIGKVIGSRTVKKKRASTGKARKAPQLRKRQTASSRS